MVRCRVRPHAHSIAVISVLFAYEYLMAIVGMANGWRGGRQKVQENKSSAFRSNARRFFYLCSLLGSSPAVTFENSVTEVTATGTFLRGGKMMRGRDRGSRPVVHAFAECHASLCP